LISDEKRYKNNAPFVPSPLASPLPADKKNCTLAINSINLLEMNPPNDHILLFDGVCNLCSHSVNFILDRDPKDKFRFASLQSEKGQALLQTHSLPTQDFNSFVYIKKGKVYLQSTAALKVLQTIGGLWSLLYLFIIVPPFIRDSVYDFISKNRYKFFGKKEMCRVPTPEERVRFL